MYEVGDKFIIEIDDLFKGKTTYGKDDERLYRIKGFNSLVFDEDGLNQLSIYSKNIMIDMMIEDGYNNGLNDMWEAITLITGLYHNNIQDIFGYETLNDVTKYNSAKDFIKKIKSYDKQRRSKEFKLKVIHELKQFAEPKNSVWDFNAHHYVIYYDYAKKKIRYNSTAIMKFSDITFATEEMARKAVKAVGEDRIKKYYFEVEE